MSLRLPEGIESLPSSLEPTRPDLSLLPSLVQEEEVGINRRKDRISLLPESLQCHILSFLMTEEAVRTSVLSSRWRNLWKWVPRLELDSEDFPDDEACVDFINKFLNFQSESCLREFDLFMYTDEVRDVASLYEPCLGKLSKRKIQHFHVQNCRNIEIPLTLTLCEALVFLNLYNVRLNDSESLYLQCLKIMYLEDVIFPSSSSVLDTPRLEYLSLIDSHFKSFKIINMSDSTKVNIDVDFDDLSERNIIYNLLNNFSSVGDMTISWQTLKLIYRLQHMNPLPKFHGLTRLRATMSLKASWKVLPIVLESCPNLKHLSLKFVKKHDSVAVVTMLSNVLSFCLVSSLEYVEMESPMFKEKATEQKLVRYFLDNATSHKKLVLRLSYPKKHEHGPGF